MAEVAPRRYALLYPRLEHTISHLHLDCDATTTTAIANGRVFKIILLNIIIIEIETFINARSRATLRLSWRLRRRVVGSCVELRRVLEVFVFELVFAMDEVGMLQTLKRKKKGLTMVIWRFHVKGCILGGG